MRVKFSTYRVNSSYVWVLDLGLVILTFGGYILLRLWVSNSYVFGLHFLRLKVGNFYAWVLDFFRLGVSSSYFGGKFSYVYGLVILTFEY